MFDTFLVPIKTIVVATEVFVFCFACFLVFVLPLRWRFALAMVFSVLQLHVFSVGGIYPSIAFLISFSLFPETMKHLPELIKKFPFMLVVVLILFQILSFLWSSDIRFGVRTVAYEVPFLMMFSATFQLYKTMPEFVDKVLVTTCLLVLVNAVLVILFRFSPELEWAYLNSGFAGLFAGPNTIDAFLDGSERNNVIDPVKSGGFFVNANVAASYLGLSSFIAFYYGIKNNNMIFLLGAAVLWFSIWFTGSKAGIMLSVLLPLSAVTVFKYARSAFNEKVVLLLFVIIVLLIVFLIVSVLALEGILQETLFVSDSIKTTNIRLLIWLYALKEFFHSPILGQGFGGWQNSLENYALETGFNVSFPPHNTFVYLWSQSGVAAVGVALLFIAGVFLLCYRLLKIPDFESRLLGVTLGLIASWLFLQGMGENYGLLGEMHQLPLLAALIGVGYAKCQLHKTLYVESPARLSVSNMNSGQ